MLWHLCQIKSDSFKYFLQLSLILGQHSGRHRQEITNKFVSIGSRLKKSFTILRIPLSWKLGFLGLINTIHLIRCRFLSSEIKERKPGLFIFLCLLFFLCKIDRMLLLLQAFEDSLRNEGRLDNTKGKDSHRSKQN